MIFFDYSFYYFYKFYSRWGKGALSGAAGIVGGLQAFNLITVLIMVSSFFPTKLNIGKGLGLLIAVGLQITNHVRYVYRERPSVEQLSAALGKKSNRSKTVIRSVIFLYVLFSTIAFFASAIYAHKVKTG